jgi:hypothetical protein
LLKGIVNSKKLGRVKLGGAAIEAFRTLYVAFTKALVLVYYNVNTLIKVEIDASNFTYLGILS